MKRFLSEHNSQSENDRFVLECMFFLIIVTIFCYSFYNRKKLYIKLINYANDFTYLKFRLLSHLLFFIVLSILFVYSFIKQILL